MIGEYSRTEKYTVLIQLKNIVIILQFSYILVQVTSISKSKRCKLS